MLRTSLDSLVSARRMLGMDVPAGYHYVSVEDFVLRRGQPYESIRCWEGGGRPLQGTRKTVMDAIRRCGGLGAFQIKQCFYNCQRLVLADRTGCLDYVEGYVQGENVPIPVLHAWVSAAGVVIDVTLRIADAEFRGKRLGTDRIYGEFPAGREYFGVTIPRAYLRRLILQRGAWQTALDDWEGNYPLLRLDPDEPIPNTPAGRHKRNKKENRCA